MIWLIEHKRRENSLRWFGYVYGRPEIVVRTRGNALITTKRKRVRLKKTCLEMLINNLKIRDLTEETTSILMKN